MGLSDAIDKIEGKDTLILSFTRRRRILETVVAFAWALKDGGYAGFISLLGIERLRPAQN